MSIIIIIVIIISFIIGYSVGKFARKDKISGTLFMKSNQEEGFDECFFEFIEIPDEVKKRRRILINVKKI